MGTTIFYIFQEQNTLMRKKGGSTKLWRGLLENTGVKLEKNAYLKETGKVKNSKERNKQRREVAEEIENKKLKNLKVT